MHTHTHANMRVHTDTCMNTHADTHTHTQIHARTHTCAHTHSLTHIEVHAHMHTHSGTHSYIYVYICIHCTCIHVDIYIPRGEDLVKGRKRLLTFSSPLLINFQL